MSTYINFEVNFHEIWISFKNVQNVRIWLEFYHFLNIPTMNSNNKDFSLDRAE